MSMLSLMVISLIGVVSAVIIRSYKPEFSFIIILLLSFLFLGWLVTVLAEVKQKFEYLASFFRDNQLYYEILFKITIVTYLCEFTSGLCKDAGYNSISTQIEMAGKVMILLSAIPVIMALIEVIENYQI